MTKGADSIIEPRLRDKHSLEKTAQYLESYANEGLRTLVIAEKTIDEEFWSKWKARYDAAQLLMAQKDDVVAALAEELEHSFELVGSTAIEDKL